MEFNLNKRKDDFLFYGQRIGLFDEYEAHRIKNNVFDRITIVEDYTLVGESQLVQNNDGSKILRINPNYLMNKTEYYIDELIFHELFHAASEINKEISKINADNQRGYYDRPVGRIVPFEERVLNKGHRSPNNLNQYPGWGFLLLDEALAQYTAQALVEVKLSKKIYSTHQSSSRIYPSYHTFSTSLAFYGEYEEPATCFSKLIVGNRGLLALASLSLNNEFLDTVFDRVSDEDTLYDILGYMGDIGIAVYADQGHINEVPQNSVQNRRPSNVLNSFQALKSITDSKHY